MNRNQTFVRRELDSFTEMETEVLSRDGFGGSLSVEKVQALASKNLKDQATG